MYRGFESLDDFEKAIAELRSRSLAEASDPDNASDTDNGVHRAHDG